MDDAVTLRRGGPADVMAIRALTLDAYAKWVPLIGGKPRPMTADYDEAVRIHRFDLLEVDGRLAALIETIPAADHLTVENLAVAPAFQKRGFGRRLMAHAEQIAVSLGVDEVRLYTNARFSENLQLYGRLGYELDREESFGGNVIVHMKKRVSRESGARGPAGPAAAS